MNDFAANLFLISFLNSVTLSCRSNILMELAKSAKDDALRELLVNRQTYG
jgi:hypothetical protein